MIPSDGSAAPEWIPLHQAYFRFGLGRWLSPSEMASKIETMYRRQVRVTYDDELEKIVIKDGSPSLELEISLRFFSMSINEADGDGSLLIDEPLKKTLNTADLRNPAQAQYLFELAEGLLFRFREGLAAAVRNGSARIFARPASILAPWSQIHFDQWPHFSPVYDDDVGDDLIARVEKCVGPADEILYSPHVLPVNIAPSTTPRTAHQRCFELFRDIIRQNLEAPISKEKLFEMARTTIDLGITRSMSDDIRRKALIKEGSPASWMRPGRKLKA